MQFNFAKKTALVTGATSGIGLETARAFGRAGANVVLAGRRADRGIEAADAMRKAGARAVFIQTDISIESDVENLIGETIATYGQIDFAFNNAGIIEAQAGPMLSRTSTEFDQIFNTNVRGLFYCMRRQLASMVAQGNGVVVNNASIAGVTGVGGIALYSASKHAIVGLTKSVALEVASVGVRVNAILPDATHSEMLDRPRPGRENAIAALRSQVPMRRLAAEREQASVVLFLCSDAASFISGAAIPVDGGRIAGMNYLAPQATDGDK